MTRRAPSDLAKRALLPLGKVSYRVCTGANLGLLELVDWKPGLGAIEHYYNSRGRAYVSGGCLARGPSP